MKIDKKKLEEMTKLSDEELWQKISSIATEHGVKMPQSMPAASELAKVRETLSNPESISLMGAMRMVNNLKKGEK